MPLLSVDNLSVGYHTRKGFIDSVETVSFSLNKGKSLGFVGESGCGKTTIGMALMRLLPANAVITHGRVMFDGRNLLEISEEEMRKIRWKRIAMIFQAAMNALNPVQRVGEQIKEAIVTHDPEISMASANRQVEKLFDLVGITAGRMRDFPHNYSGGMKQRVVIAMALACNPDLIIADEPTTALDVIVQSQILTAIKKLQKELDIGLIFISHDIAVVADVCDSINIMFAGQVIETGRREEVFAAPMHPYTKSLLASYLTLDGKKPLPTPYSKDPTDLNFSLEGCRFCDRCPVSGPACSHTRPEWKEISPTHKVLCDKC
ncbi:MAG: ABC transporter ATP-binding protein [Desulfobacterales bacterium]